MIISIRNPDFDESLRSWAKGKGTFMSRDDPDLPPGFARLGGSTLYFSPEDHTLFLAAMAERGIDIEERLRIGASVN